MNVSFKIYERERERKRRERERERERENSYQTVLRQIKWDFVSLLPFPWSGGDSLAGAPPSDKNSLCGHSALARGAGAQTRLTAGAREASVVKYFGVKLLLGKKKCYGKKKTRN